MSAPICSAEDCASAILARGLCAKHYHRFRWRGVLGSSPKLQDRRATRNANWRGGRVLSRGYVFSLAPEHPRAGSRRYVPEHILIVERALGHYLLPPAEVHHRDENRANNSPSNLVVCQDSAYHKLLHSRTRAYRATGNARSRRCIRCHEWMLPDDPDRRVVRVTPKTPQGQAYHRSCDLTLRRARHARQRAREKATA